MFLLARYAAEFCPRRRTLRAVSTQALVRQPAIPLPSMVARLRALEAARPDIWAMMLMLGREREAEWIHSVGVAMDETLRMLAPPIPPPALRALVAAQEEEIFLWTRQSDLGLFLQLYEKHAQSLHRTRTFHWRTARSILPTFYRSSLICRRRPRWHGLQNWRVSPGAEPS